jgi:beta-1,4-mannosyl-glycoprotein beta-1,4-N-acetylglucosaminyltransferase
MMRIELTQSRIRFLILGFLISAILILISTTERVRTPIIEKVKQPFGEHPAQAPPHPTPTPPTARPDDAAAAPPLVATPVQDGQKAPAELEDHTGYLSDDDALEFCSYRRYNPFRNRSKKRKIFDLILVNKELDWLEIRLGQMYPYVDYFVITEADITFTEQPKTLYIKENWDRFKPYHDKMIRHTIDWTGGEFNRSWDRESWSRNAMVTQVLPKLDGVQKMETDDVIIIADVDEIPRPSTLKTLRNCEVPEKVNLNSQMYYYSFQWLNRINGEWPHPQAMLWKGDKTPSADELRTLYGQQPSIYNGAWHCSYCFSTLAEMSNKVESFSHTEFNKPEFRDPEKILNRVRKGLDFFDRADSNFDRVDDNADVPEVLLKNREKYAFALNRDPPNGNFRDYPVSKAAAGTA